MAQAAVYAGSFDPPTLGHLDILKRVAPHFSKVYVVIAKNHGKSNSLFTPEERAELIKDALEKHLPDAKVSVHVHSGLVVDFCREKNVKVLVRGLRAMSDFEKEFQIATMNRKFAPEIETMHVMTDEKYFFVSSTLVKEVAPFTDALKDLVPINVRKAVVKKLKEKSP